MKIRCISALLLFLVFSQAYCQDLLSPEEKADIKRFLPHVEKLDTGITLYYGDDFLCSNDRGIFKEGCSTEGVSKISYVKNVISLYLSHMQDKGKNVIAVLKKNAPSMLLFNTFDHMEAATEHAQDFFDMHQNSQDLYASETFVSNNYSKGRDSYKQERNATLEEVLHLIHNYGISEAYPKWQKRLEKATSKALKNGYLVWEDANNDGIGDDINVLPRADLDDEYLAAAVEVYYDQKGADGYLQEESLCVDKNCEMYPRQTLIPYHNDVYLLIGELFDSPRKFYDR